MRKLDDANKRKKYPLWLSEGERLLLEAKAEEYQYKYLADYIRDAAIYESLIKVNLTGSENLISCYQKYISEIKKYTKEVRRILHVEVGKNIKIAVVKISNDNGYKKLLLDIIYINCQFVNDLSTKFF